MFQEKFTNHFFSYFVSRGTGKYGSAVATYNTGIQI